jgi:hypothetical protein
MAKKADNQPLGEGDTWVVHLLHESRAHIRAPAALRARIDALGQAPARRLPLSARYAAGLAVALAAVLLAVVLVAPVGTPGGPSLSQAAGLATKGIAAPAPIPDPSTPGAKLERNLEDVYFPNWASQFGWRASGQRTDRVAGRLAVTVYYDWHNKRIAYTIVAAPALKQPAAQVRSLNGTELRTLTMGGRLVVTWRRAGHTCVLSGAGIPSDVLQHLAAWSAPGLEHA